LDNLVTTFLFVGNKHNITVELEGLGGGGTIDLEVRTCSIQECVVTTALPGEGACSMPHLTDPSLAEG
jgi:hypothetical protein